MTTEQIAKPSSFTGYLMELPKGKSVAISFK